MTIPVFPDTKVALKGKKGLIVGIANDQPIAWGCAKAFRALGADLAVTYLNDRAKKHVEPLAQALEAPIFVPLDVNVEGQTEQVFERIEKEWGRLDFMLHSIAFSPKEALHGRVVDVGRDGFLKTMDVSCWSFMRMAHLAEPLMKNGGTMFTMTYYGSQMVVENYNVMGVAKAALESAVRYMAAELGPKGIRVHAISPGPLATRAASGIPEFDELLDKAQSKAPTRSLVSIDDVGNATAFLALDGAKLIWQCYVYRWRLSHHRLSAVAGGDSPVVQSNQLGNTGRALAALDLDHEMIVGAQAIRRHVLRLGDRDAAAQPRPRRHRRQIPYPVRAVVQRGAQSLQPDHRPDEERCERERQQTVGDGGAAGQFLFGALLIDMDPLLVAGRFREAVDAVLSHLDPVAGADLCADRGVDMVEVGECPQVRHRSSVCDIVGNDEFGLRDGHHLADAHAGRGSSRVALPSGNARTAMSVTTRLTDRAEVRGRLHLATIFDLPFAACCMATMTRLAPLTRSIAPPMPGTILPGIIQFARCPCAPTCTPPSTHRHDHRGSSRTTSHCRTCWRQAVR